MISEAKKHGVYVILSLVNNWKEMGGKQQYVQWARDRGQRLNNDDEFFTNPVVKGFYKNHVKVLPPPFFSSSFWVFTLYYIISVFNQILYMPILIIRASSVTIAPAYVKISDPFLS